MRRMGKYSVFLFFLFSLLASGSSYAQYFPSEYWHDGWIVNDDADTLRGEIKYDLPNDLVQVRNRDRINTFSSRKIVYIEFYDKTTENYRQFYSLPYAVNYDYKVPMLFELLYEGELSLLTRESIVQETVPSVQSYSFSGYNQTRQRLDYSFYFLDKKGNIRLYNGKKPELQDAMRDRWSEVKPFMKKNHLSPDKIRDLVRIVAFYNSVK
jgi:hypothetical protein